MTNPPNSELARESNNDSSASLDAVVLRACLFCGTDACVDDDESVFCQNGACAQIQYESEVQHG